MAAGDEVVIHVVDVVQADPPATSRQTHPLAATIGCLAGAAHPVPRLDDRTARLAEELLEIVERWEDAVRQGVPIPDGP